MSHDHAGGGAAAGRQAVEVRTVLGAELTDDVGPAMMHEHLFWDARGQWETLVGSGGWGGHVKGRTEQTAKFRVDLAGHARFDVTYLRENWANPPGSGFRRTVREVGYFQAAEGNTLVDLTPHGIAPSPLALRRLSVRTGIRIIAGAGIYTHDTHLPWMEHATTGDFENFFLGEVEEGVGRSGVMPGILAKMGTSARPRRCEIRALSGAARVAARTGLALCVHCHPSTRRVTLSLVDAVQTEGLAPTRTILSHLDEVPSHDYLVSILALGVVLSFDGFGHDHYPGPGARRLSDRSKLAMLARLVADGYSHQLVLSQDVCRLHMLRGFGGTGYDHVLSRIVPSLSQTFHVPRDKIHEMLSINPTRLLAVGERLTDGSPG